MIWDRLIAKNVFFVAEIGKGFIQTPEDRSTEEYLANAKKLIKAAKRAGADAVKFQTHTVDDEQMPIDVMSPHFKGSDRYSWVKRNTEATPLEFWQELKRYCDEVDITFFSTPMSRGAAQLLDRVGVKLWKVGSGDILDFVLLDYLRASGKPIIMSSGMSQLAELDMAVAFLREKTKYVALLHCISRYPCPAEEVHLNVIPFFQQRYGMPIGFSDHSIGYKTVLGAVQLGATIIEKHFSMSRDLWGSDYKVAMTPSEFFHMVKRVRKGNWRVASSEQYYGDQIIDELPDYQSGFRRYFRKTLIAAQDIPAGTVIAPQMVYAMRPQAFLIGLPSERYEDVVGSLALDDLPARSPIKVDAIAWKEDARVAL